MNISHWSPLVYVLNSPLSSHLIVSICYPGKVNTTASGPFFATHPSIFSPAHILSLLFSWMSVLKFIQSSFIIIIIVASPLRRSCKSGLKCWMSASSPFIALFNMMFSRPSALRNNSGTGTLSNSGSQAVRFRMSLNEHCCRFLSQASLMRNACGMSSLWWTPNLIMSSNTSSSPKILASGDDQYYLMALLSLQWSSTGGRGSHLERIRDHSGLV